MILSDETLRTRYPLIVDPFCLRSVHVGTGMSYGLSCAGYDVRVREGCLLAPQGFRLLSTRERFEMPDDVVGMVCDKSTLARQGLTVQNTIIEPGWCGYLTLEITNHSWWFRRIVAGQPIAQILFFRTDYPVCRPYAGKYQDQPPEPVSAKREGQQ